MDTITLTQGQIESLLSNQALVTTVRKGLPIKQAYWLAKAMTKMQQEHKAFIEARQEIIERYAARDEKGAPVSDAEGRVVWAEGKTQDAAKAIEEIRGISIDLGILPIAMDWNTSDTFTVQDMMLLMPLLAEPEE